MKTYEQLREEALGSPAKNVRSFAQIEAQAAKAYAKQFLNEAAKRLEAYDDERGLLSQIAYKIMDEIDAQ